MDACCAYTGIWIQEYRNTGIQEYIQEYRNTGTHEYRNTDQIFASPVAGRLGINNNECCDEDYLRTPPKPSTAIREDLLLWVSLILLTIEAFLFVCWDQVKEDQKLSNKLTGHFIIQIFIRYLWHNFQLRSHKNTKDNVFGLHPCLVMTTFLII